MALKVDMYGDVDTIGELAVVRVRLDADQLSSLFESHGDALLRYFSRRTFDVETALDLVGDTFAVAFAKRGQFRGSTAEEAVGWLYSIARTVLGRYVRRGKAERRALQRLGVELPAMSEDEQQRAERLAGLDELRVAVGEALDDLPPDQQAAVRLRVVEELGYAHVAARLGIREATARARVSRGLRALHDALNVTEETRDVSR